MNSIRESAVKIIQKIRPPKKKRLGHIYYPDEAGNICEYKIEEDGTHTTKIVQYATQEKKD